MLFGMMPDRLQFGTNTKANAETTPTGKKIKSTEGISHAVGSFPYRDAGVHLLHIRVKNELRQVFPVALEDTKAATPPIGHACAS